MMFTFQKAVSQVLEKDILTGEIWEKISETEKEFAIISFLK